MTVVPVPVLDLVTLVMLLLLVVELLVTVLRLVVRLVVELWVKVVAYGLTFRKPLSCSCHVQLKDMLYNQIIPNHDSVCSSCSLSLIYEYSSHTYPNFATTLQIQEFSC